MMKFRLIVDEFPRSAAENMAIDLALQRLCSIPTLRIYSWSPPAVSIGRFQCLRQEVDIDFCKRNGIDFVRRITGGGAVFHDREITYSFSISEENSFFSSDLQESYKKICGGVINALKLLGVSASYSGINDIVVGDKKISGCAQTRKNGVVLQHGTLLVDVDPFKMFGALEVSEEKIRDKFIDSVRERVTSVNEILQKELPMKELVQIMVRGFSLNFDVEFENSFLSSEELALSEKIKKDLFENDSWTYER